MGQLRAAVWVQLNAEGAEDAEFFYFSSAVSAPSAFSTCLDKIGYTLGYHHSGYVGAGAAYVGHYGGVGYPEIGDAANAELPV